MKNISFSEAIDETLAIAMAKNDRIILFGEDVNSIHFSLYVRFGEKRVRSTPISEAAFVGAAVAAAMAGLRPVVEVMLVDFIGVAMDALLNHAAKIDFFSGGRWKVPMVLRATCGGGYGDGGQHEQSLWGWLAHIPGLVVVVPSNPLDAGGLMLAALEYEGPAIYLEHKLLSNSWLDFLGKGGRSTVFFNVPTRGTEISAPKHWNPVEIGKASIKRKGGDITLISIGVGVHRALEAAEVLQNENIAASVIDLRTVVPIDKETICNAVSKSGRVIVIDEDYKEFGLSGEIAAVLLETGMSFKFERICTESTIPYARHLEDEILPNTKRILHKARKMLERP